MEIPSNVRAAGWKPAAWLRVTGEDAAAFLQGQFTNELRGLKMGEAAYGLWLNQKGKVLADSFVVAGAAGEFFVVSYFGSAAVIRQRLEDYIIADDVTVEDLTAEGSGVVLVGAGARRALEAMAGGGRVFAGRRAAVESAEWIFPRAEEAGVWARLGAFEALAPGELERLRIGAGIPAVPADIGPGDLPGEGGLEAVAISYTKGCYLGQEVMARLKSMGQVRRRLRRVAGAGNPPTLPSALWQAGRQVGELRSAAVSELGFVGLAMISLINCKPAEGLALEAAGAPALNLIPDGA